MFVRKFISHIIILRPINVLISGISIIIASRIIQPDNSIILVSTLALIVMLFTSGANTLNDFIDYKIDLINRPSRPIPIGDVKKSVAFYMALSFFIMGSLLCMQLNENAKIIGIFIAMPIMVLYTTYLKKLPLIGNLAVAFTIGLSFIFCGAAFNSFSPMIIPMILCFLLSFLRELIKDIADIEGDQVLGLKTFPIYYGLGITKNFVLTTCFISGLVFIVPYVIGIYNEWYLFFLIVGVEIPLGFIVFLMVKNPGITSAKKAARILKISTFFGLIAIYTGSTL